jgi:hypothetical protein
MPGRLQERDMGIEKAGWHLAWGNVTVFVIACMMTVVLGDPSAMIA